MHQFSDSYSMPLLQRTENSVILSGSAEQYSNRWNIPCSLMCLFLGWGIYFWPYNERGTGGCGPVFLAQGSHITETAHQPAAAAGRRIKGPVGSPVHSTALLFFILSSQKWVVWIQAGACWLEKSVGSLRPHLCFSCLPRRVPILSVITKLIEEPERKLYFPAPPLSSDFDGKCPHVASCQICLDLECRHASSRKSIASDILVGSFSRFPRCVCLQL